MERDVPPLRPVPGWEGSYAVSADGHVWSLPRLVTTKAGWQRKTTLRRMKRQSHNKGYWYVTLRRPDGSEAKQLVHRLVALAWVPNEDEARTQVNHKDGKRRNASAANLEWCTCSENHQHAYSTGQRTATEKQRHAAGARARARRSLNPAQVQHLKDLVASGTTQREAARIVGCSAPKANQIINKRRYVSA